MNPLWQPRSPCDPSCLPRRGTIPTVHFGVRVARLAAVAAILVVGALLVPVASRVSGALARGVLRALGIRVVVRGRLPKARALLAANHVSWVDILVLLAYTRGRIVAKREVRGWPVVGAFAAAVGTIFIDRSRPRTLPSTVADAAAALRAGDLVAAFPEGTTWCGRGGGRFRPALFQAALDAGAVVAPVTLRYTLKDGGSTAAAAFLGDDTLIASVGRVVAIRGLTVTLTARTALYPDESANRRWLARMAGSAVHVAEPALTEASPIAMYRVRATLPPWPDGPWSPPSDSTSTSRSAGSTSA